MAGKKKRGAQRYELLNGINYPGADGEERRAEAGDVVDDLPSDAVADLVAQGDIRPEGEEE